MQTGYILTKFDQGEWRRSKVIEKVWQGNTLTVSTSFWGLVYDLLPETGLFNVKLSPIIAKLKQRNLIEFNNNGLVRLTERGDAIKNKYYKEHYIPQNLHVNLSYDLLAFREMFLLANQTISELSYQNAKFYPYQIDLRLQWQVKQWLKRHAREELVNRWYQELQEWLQTQSEMEAMMFTNMMFGHQLPNKLFSEVAYPPTWEEFDSQLWQLDKLAALMTHSIQTGGLFYDFMQLAQRSLLSNSAQRSVELWQERYTISTIAKLRNIKITTVREHILHAVILQNWSIEAIKSLIPVSEQMKLASIYKSADITMWDYHQYNNSSDPVYFTYFRLYQLICLSEVRTSG